MPGASGCLPGASGAGGYLPGASGAGGYLPGASGGGASLVPVAAWILARILQPGPQAGTHANSSARRAVSRLNQSCRVRLIDAITLIINYLGAPFGCAFT